MVDLDRSFGFLVNDVARLYGRRFDHNVRRLGLTRAQCRTLGYLARNEGINQAGLADLLEIRPMTLVRQVDRMEDAGWIERRPDPADRRARRLFLTDKGHRVRERVLDIATETRSEALLGLSPRDNERLLDLLERVHNTLSDRVPPAPFDAPRSRPADRDGRPERSRARTPMARTPMAAVEGDR